MQTLASLASLAAGAVGAVGSEAHDRTHLDSWRLRLREFSHTRLSVEEPTRVRPGPLVGSAALLIVHAGELRLCLPEPSAVLRLGAGELVLLGRGSGWELAFGEGAPTAKVVELVAARSLVPCPPLVRPSRAAQRAEVSLVSLGFDDDATLDVLEDWPPVLRPVRPCGMLPALLSGLAGLDGQDWGLFEDATIFARVLELCVLDLLRRRPHDLPGGRASAPIRRSVELMRRDLAADWRVAVLAARVGLSRSAFAGRFTSEVGEPPLRHLAKLRLRAAADHLLRCPGEPIKSIAAWVGYGSMPSFCKAFRGHFGVAPGAYRLRGGHQVLTAS